MPSDNKNIDQFFRGKSAEVETDTSGMDQHWKQMQSLLSPAVPATGAAAKLMRMFSKKTLLLFAAAAIMGAFFFIVVLKNGNHTNAEKQEATTIAALQIIFEATTLLGNFLL